MRAPFCLTVLTLLWIGTCHGQPPLATPLPAETPDFQAQDGDPITLLPAEQAQALQNLLEYLVRENLPREHVDEDDWGRTKRVYAGFRITHDDWKLSTKRRWKEVKHGRWQRFSVQLATSKSPENAETPENPKNLRVGVQILSWDPEAGQLRARLTLDSTLNLFARRMRYNYGVRLFSIHAEGSARARLTLDAAITIGLDYEELPPGVTVTPQVEQATLQISEFHLKRLSQLHGDPAEWAGEVVDEWLQKKWLPKQNQQLADRMNEQIKKQTEQGSLRFSMSDWLQSWLQP